MKQIILLVVLLLVSDIAFALTGKTRGGDVACIKEKDVLMVIRLAQTGAQESAMHYFQSGKCIILKGGKRVVMVTGPGIFGAMTQFHYRRFVLWSVREAVIYDTRNP